MVNPQEFPIGSLSREDIELIEATMLPVFDKHYLRLLAHCLACFRVMANGSKSGPLPTHQIRFNWCTRQPALVDEQSFIPVLLKQLDVAGQYLEALASAAGISPLELELQDLIKASVNLPITTFEGRK